jgi:tRNA(Ile2) C34 agmatinyltransferase TiaS
MSLCTDGKKVSQSSDIDDLKRGITEAAAAVACNMLRRVWEELDYRFDICRVTYGVHIECL